MNLILWIIFGGLAGWLASIVVGVEEGLGLFGNIAVGVLGAFLGGWVSDKVGMGGEPGADRPTSLVSFFWAVIGAVILLLLLNLLF
ncbi:MAG: GlsB/YeaQ/YmgE family stress response membrane protein [Candidatus Paceibacterota bacterium]